MEISPKSLKLNSATTATVSKPKPLMLKDYLRDDFSSCSSNGFRSFSRKQCCTTTTIRLLLEIDLKSAKPPSPSSMVIKRSRSKAASATVSALHRASIKFVNAIKLLPLPSVRSQLVQSGGVKRGWFFPRTFSRKLSKRSFWKKQPLRKEKESNDENEIKRWRLFRDFLEEKEQDHQPLDQNTSQTSLSHCVSTSSSSSHKRNSCSWGSSEFTSDSLSSSSTSHSESPSNKDYVVPVEEKKQEKNRVSGREGVAAGGEEESSTEVTTPSSKVNWPNEVKEQFSPVSILDCPFKDDEEISLRNSPPCTEGNKPKLTSKFSLLKRLDQLKPIDLEKRYEGCNGDNEEINETISATVEGLLSATKSRNPSCDYNVINLLSDFFLEKLEEDNAIIGKKVGEGNYINQDYILKVGEDWFNGHPQEFFLGWEMENERKAYLRNMEKGGKWRTFYEEIDEVASDLEVEIWASLMEEVFVV